MKAVKSCKRILPAADLRAYPHSLNKRPPTGHPIYCTLKTHDADARCYHILLFQHHAVGIPLEKAAHFSLKRKLVRVSTVALEVTVDRRWSGLATASVPTWSDAYSAYPQRQLNCAV